MAPGENEFGTPVLGRRRAKREREKRFPKEKYTELVTLKLESQRILKFSWGEREPAGWSGKETSWQPSRGYFL